jgi:hypothetical protein
LITIEPPGRQSRIFRDLTIAINHAIGSIQCPWAKLSETTWILHRSPKSPSEWAEDLKWLIYKVTGTVDHGFIVVEVKSWSANNQGYLLRELERVFG